MIGECKDYLAVSATARRPKWRLSGRLRNVMVGRRFKRSETLVASIRGVLIRQTWKRARKAKHAGTRKPSRSQADVMAQLKLSRSVSGRSVAPGPR
jgi:hypothetical protein